MPRLALVARRVEGLSGAARLILEEARAAAAAGWEVHVFGESLDREAVRAAGAIPRWVPGWPWGSLFKRRLFAALAGRAVRGFELAHGHGDLLDQDVLSLHNCVHAAHEASKGRPLPEDDAVGLLHSEQLRGRRFRALAANSQLMKDELIARFGVPESMIEVLYPAIDPARFRPEPGARPRARAALGVPDDALLFGLVTSGDFEKRGLSVFLEAFASAARALGAARALVVGKENRLGAYRRKAAELGIAERVSFLDPRPDVETLYRALDVYVHAARWEEFGMTVLEAMACGIPVIAGRRAGAAELLSGEGREFVLNEPSAGALADAMLRLGGDAALRETLSAQAAASAASRHWAAHNRQLLSLYDRLLKVKEGQARGYRG